MRMIGKQLIMKFIHRTLHWENNWYLFKMGQWENLKAMVIRYCMYMRYLLCMVLAGHVLLTCLLHFSIVGLLVAYSRSMLVWFSNFNYICSPFRLGVIIYHLIAEECTCPYLCVSLTGLSMMTELSRTTGCGWCHLYYLTLRKDIFPQLMIIGWWYHLTYVVSVYNGIQARRLINHSISCLAAVRLTPYKISVSHLNMRHTLIFCFLVSLIFYCMPSTEVSENNVCNPNDKRLRSNGMQDCLRLLEMQYYYILQVHRWPPYHNLSIIHYHLIVASPVQISHPVRRSSTKNC